MAPKLAHDAPWRAFHWSPTALYRFYDEDGDLLYVGITCSPYRRFPEHEADKPWFNQIADIDVEWFYSRELAEDAENVAIWQERPRYNIARTLPRNPPVGKRRRSVVSVGDLLFDLVEELIM